MYQASRKHRKAFSLIELVIVIVIIGVISAIAIPRMTRGAQNAGATALKGSLSVMRSSIELYRTEHDGKFPTATSVATALTAYTKIDGSDANATPDVASGRIYGPYVRKIPPLPVGLKKNSTGIAATDRPGVGWIYEETTGDIKANCADTELDQDGVKYNTY